MSSKVVREKRLSEVEMKEHIKNENPELWDEVAEFMSLLREWGFTGYRLTGPVEEPIVTSYTFSKS